MSERDLILSALRDIPDGTGSREAVADFLAERFVVIGRVGVPVVEPERPGYAEYVYINGELRGLMADVEEYDDAIRELVALREYRREHPFIDDDMVEELWKALVDSGLDLDLAEARRLAQQGIRVVEVAS